MSSTPTRVAGTIRVVHWTEIQPERHYRTPHRMVEEERHRAWQSGEADRTPRSSTLDRRSDTPPLLARLMDQALLRITLRSDGATASLDSKISGKGGSSRAPKSSLAGELDHLVTRWTRARTNRQRLHVIRDAQAIGSRLLKVDRSQVRGTDEWKRTVGTDTRSCRAVAAHYRVSLRDVVRYRKQYRTDTEQARELRESVGDQ